MSELQYAWYKLKKGGRLKERERHFAGCKRVKLKLFGSEYDATEGLGVDQLGGGVALPRLSIKIRC